MIAFGTCIVDPGAYLAYARPGIQAAAEPGATVFAFEAVGNVSRSNNLLLDAAGRLEDLEALVLVEEHMELRQPELCAMLRAAFADPDVAVVGCVGAADVRTIAWWEGRICRGDLRQRHHDHGGGELDAFGWAEVERPPRTVDTVDGRFMALSPWAVRSLRFDEELSLGFGHDLDFCLQSRAAGREVVVAPVRAVVHQRLELVPDREVWVEGHIRFAEKWDGRMPGGTPTEDWKARARRAEAERDAARTLGYSSTSTVDARLAPLERELDALTTSPSWRITRPLRELNRRRRQR